MTPKWGGRVAAVLATGPSLTLDDVEACREAGMILVGVNGAWEMTPHLDALYAGDNRYWKHNVERIEASGFTGKRYSKSQRAETHYGAKYIRSRLGQDYNSGELAVEMAVRFKADLIVMLGFDASVKDGYHCHGPHTTTANPNESRCSRWLQQFARIPKVYPKAHIVNCSRKTAIETFRRDTLESVIASLPELEVRDTVAA